MVMDTRSKIKLKLAILLSCLLVSCGWWIYHSTMPRPIPDLTSNSSSATPPRNVPALSPTSTTHSNSLGNASLSLPPSSPSTLTTTHLPPAPNLIPEDPTKLMPILQVYESPDTTHPDLIKRVRIVRANFKYPIWRIEEVVTKPQSGKPETIQSRNVMIADHVMIRLNQDSDRAQLESLVKSQGLAIRKTMTMPGCFLISIPDESTNALPNLLAKLSPEKGLIRYVEPDYVVRSQQTTPNDPNYSLLWGLNNTISPDADISAPQIWELTTGNSQIVIADIDTGMDYNHPDLASNVWHNTGETLNGLDDDNNGKIDDVTGWNFVSENNSPLDGQGHGTHTAGTIGAVGNNGLGLVGVNWHCRLMPLKFLNDSGDGVISDATEALAYVSHLRRRGVNIKITNNSWGGGGYSAMFREALADHAACGILFMAAAGNESQNNDLTPFYPSAYPESNVIAIAATDSHDALAYFSHYGTNTVHLGAPGVNTFSTLNGARYGYMSGTSMATPHVSGAAALLWSLWPSAHADDIRDAILKGVDVIPALVGKTITGGRLNARKSVDTLFRIIHTPRENAFNSGAGYAIECDIGPLVLTDTNQIFVYWALNGSSNFTATACLYLSNNTFKALIPEQAEGSELHYWIQATATNGSEALTPANAPTNSFHFMVVPGATLTVTGTPAPIANPWPDYGENNYYSGKVIQASAPLSTSPDSGKRWSCTGWTGTGNVPAIGSSNALSFSLSIDSTLDWQWQEEAALIYTSLYPPLNTTNWWIKGSTANSLLAPDPVTIAGATYRFAGWSLDGLRQPDLTSPAVNPILNISMTSPHLVSALYIPESRDSDLNGINDWWESLYRGSLATEPTADPDEDGYDNLHEFIDQTNPCDSNSVPRPPVIINTTLTNQQVHPAPYTLSALITDNCRVVSATLTWSRNGAPATTTPMIAGTGHLFTAAIPAPGTNGDSFVYSFSASDPLASTTNGPYTLTPCYPVIASTPSRFNVQLLPETTSNLFLSVTNSGLGIWQGHLTVLAGGLSNDVENGAIDWSHTGTNDLWNICPEWAVSGSNAWYCGNPETFYYNSSMHSKLDSTPFYVATGSQLTFKQWMECELDGQYWRVGWSIKDCWDGGIVEISTNFGTSFIQIHPVGGYPNKISGYVASPWPDETPCFAGDGSGWSQPTFDLSAFSGSVAILRFHFGSDDNTEETGWFIDDIVVTPTPPPPLWLQPVSTNITAAPQATTLIPLAHVNSMGIPTGDREAALLISANTLTAPRMSLPTQLKVRSPSTLTWSSARQSSTQGEGLVTLSNQLYDADGDACLATLEWSTPPYGAWSNTALLSVTAEVGTAMLTGLSTLPLSNLLTRSQTGFLTNTLTSVWNSQNPSNAIGFASNALVRARAWDGLFWSNWTTSQPFMVDNEAPPTPAHFISLVHQTNAWSKNPIMSLRWDLTQEMRGSGVTNYEYGTTVNPAILISSGTTTGRTSLTPPVADGTNNWAWVRARDHMGNRSTPAFFGPCWIDATPPSAAEASITLALSPFGHYVVGSNSVTGTWTGFSDGLGSGIVGYYFAPTNAGGTTKGTWTTSTQGILTTLQQEQTNTLYVWAKDQTGWIGQAAFASVISLSPNGDWDHDGILNWQEDLAGSDALASDSVFQLGIASSDPLLPSSFTLHWPGLSNRHYTISYKDTLDAGRSWQILSGAASIAGTNGPMSFSDSTINQPSRFYRISITSP